MFKRELVARSLVPGASVAAVALEAGINSNLLFAWRRMHLSTQEQPQTPAPSKPSPMLLPVTIEAASIAPCSSPTVVAPRQPAGTIEIDVGGVRVRLRGAVDEASVRHVLQTLKALA
ncbi:transposase [Variovorax sp. OK605]|nr:transposase [Variovorax sp. OK605]SFQ55582.1 transposase [Variovorax sp. OK605]SFQ71357.1 transposase [Variovorax sp. OK605]SFQ73424.1 transposase [Variovorax sp. OK605]